MYSLLESGTLPNAEVGKGFCLKMWCKPNFFKHFCYAFSLPFLEPGTLHRGGFFGEKRHVYLYEDAYLLLKLLKLLMNFDVNCLLLHTGYTFQDLSSLLFSWKTLSTLWGYYSEKLFDKDHIIIKVYSVNLWISVDNYRILAT